MELEARIGEDVVTPLNAKDMLELQGDAGTKEGEEDVQEWTWRYVLSEFFPDISYFPFYVKLYAGQKSFVYRGFSLICLWKIGI